MLLAWGIAGLGGLGAVLRFLLDGATVQESGFSGTAIIPNLDSIAEFRILTNNFDAEYGAYAGGHAHHHDDDPPHG